MREDFAIGRRVAALCADGKTRQALILRDADTFFTIPASIRVKGKTVTGHVYYTGLEIHKTLRFSPSAWMKNADMIPAWEHKGSAELPL